MAPPPKPWPTGICEQSEPMVRRVLAGNGSPYTYTGTQTYLVGLSDLAVIDPGPDDPAHIDALMAAIAGTPVLAICCTHTHRDHSPAARALAALTGAPIIGCAPLTIDKDEAHDEPRADAPFDPDYAPDRVLADGESVCGTGWTLTAVATPGHTSNHLCFSLEESGALFSGDHVMGWSTTVVAPPDGDMGDYLASLERLYERDDRIYYPAHGPAVEQPRRLVRGMIGHRRQRERQIMRLVSQGTGNVEAMIPLMYKGVDPRLWGAAAQSTRAHLQDMERRGLVTRFEGVWTIQT